MGIAVRSHEWCVESFVRLEIIPQSAVKSTSTDSFIEEYESGKDVNNADKKIKWVQDSFPMQYYRRFDSG